MSNEHYKILVAGYNCFDKVERCLESIWTQSYRDFDVCVVDDASTDERQPAFIKEYCEARGWKYLLRKTNAGAPRSQHEGILKLDPQDGDVIVWVDLDDALIGPTALKTLDSHYDDQVAMTYGNYVPWPPSDTCPRPARYPPGCVANNDYRNIHRWGLQYNHLRTVRWDLYKHLDPDVDFKKNGRWLKLSMDMAVMIPCLEMAGGHFKYIDELLYVYTSDNPISEWRKAATGTNETHEHLASLPKKKSLWGKEMRQSFINSNSGQTRRALPPPPPKLGRSKPNIVVLVPSYNCKEFIERCLDSLAKQTYKPKKVLVIDDASTEDGYGELVDQLCEKYGFEAKHNEENIKCPRNLSEGIKDLAPDPEDVIFLLDGDDFLPHNALEYIARYYSADDQLWMTYGSYEPKPHNTGQCAAMPYPKDIIEQDKYRGYMHCFNHPLTFKAHLWDQIEDKDLQNHYGKWYTVAYDSIIMHPMLEMCGSEHYKFVSHTLYYYNAINENSDSKVSQDLGDPSKQIIHRHKKDRYVK